MRRTRSRSSRIITGINIAPFTDVVLVLLVVFMISTPVIIQSSLNVNLPQAATPRESPPASFVVTVDARGTVYYEDRPVTLEALATALTATLAAEPQTPVLIRGDREVRYDAVMQVLDAAKAAGAQRLSLGVEEKE